MFLKSQLLIQGENIYVGRMLAASLIVARVWSSFNGSCLLILGNFGFINVLHFWKYIENFTFILKKQHLNLVVDLVYGQYL